MHRRLAEFRHQETATNSLVYTLPVYNVNNSFMQKLNFLCIYIYTFIDESLAENPNLPMAVVKLDFILSLNPTLETRYQ